MSSPQCPTSAIPKAGTTSLPGSYCGKAAQESQGMPSCAAAPGEAAWGGDAWKLLFTFCVSALSQRAEPAQQLPSSSRANTALPEIPFDRSTCREGKLQTETHRALLSLVEILVGSGRGQILLPSLKGAEGMSQPCSLPSLKTWLPDPREETLT